VAATWRAAARSFRRLPLARIDFRFHHVGNGASARDEGGDLPAHPAHPRGVLTGLQRVGVAGPSTTMWMPNLVWPQQIDFRFFWNRL
jgi:hypothetical protein